MGAGTQVRAEASARAGPAAPALLTLALAVALAAACSDGEESGELAGGVTVRDSAGVAVVVNGRRALDAAGTLELGPEPELELPAPGSGGALLSQVAGVLPLPDGRLAVADAGTQAILVFGRGGELLQRLGGAGDGPGEFRGLETLLPFGDSLAGWDERKWRLSVFAPDGSHARDAEVELPGDDGASLAALPLNPSEFVIFAYGGFEDREGRFRSEAESWRVSSEGRVLSSYGRFPGPELFVAPEAMGPVLYGPVTAAATVKDGLVVGLGSEPELHFFTREGALERTVRWAHAQVPLTAARIARSLELALSGVPEAQRASARETLDRLPRGERIPPYDELVTDPLTREVWVGEYVGPERVLPGFRPPRRRWLVLDERGAVSLHVFTPEGFRLLALEGGLAWGAHTDPGGRETVRAYRLPEGRRP